MKQNSVNVVEVKFPPAIGKVQMMGGIRTKDEAARWGTENGYTTVYLLKGRERVYADRLTKRVDVLAQEILTKSNHLVQLSERGESLVECVILFCVVIFILWLLGQCLGIPW